MAGKKFDVEDEHLVRPLQVSLHSGPLISGFFGLRENYHGTHVILQHHQDDIQEMERN